MLLTLETKYTIIYIEATKQQRKRCKKVREVICSVLIVTLLIGIFAALYLRQPTGFYVAGAAGLAFAYFVIKGKE